jgi:hypothetical protein
MGTITGGHTVMGAAGPRLSWSFADGITSTGWDEYLTILNPATADAAVRLTFYVTGQSAPLVKTMVVPANSRATVAVFDAPTGLGRGQTHGTTVTSTNGVGIVVERPIYFRYSPVIDGGHTLMGAVTPANTWLFAEGYTGPGFDEYLILLNPNSTPAPVTLTYYAGGATLVRTLTVGANSRATVAVHDPAHAGRNQAVSARVETTHPGGIVAERGLYFTYAGTVDGGHAALGWTP